MPLLAMVEYAYAISRGVTPSCRPPSVMAGLVEIGVRMPMRRAILAMRRVPTLSPSWAKTELSDVMVAVRSDSTP